MSKLVVKCNYCGKRFLREKRRVNERVKFGWKIYCSPKCISKARSFRLKIKCSRFGCSKYFLRSRAEISRVKKSYCSRLCSILVTNSLRLKKLRFCANVNCRKPFRGKRKYCSLECLPPKISKYSKEKIIDAIKKFVSVNGRIPLKVELPNYYRRSRILFGTWNNAIRAAGFEPNPVLFAKKYFAKDGHKCDSLSEKIIDDWFYKRKIKHLRNVKYPGDSGFSVDFKVGDSWIEFFGLEGGLKEYDRLKRRKLDLIKKEKLNLIDLYPYDLFPKGKLNEKLQFLLE